MIPKRSSSKPSVSHSSQSGLLRSSGGERYSPITSWNWASVPGEGRVTRWTWLWTSKPGSSTHIGVPIFSGGQASFWRRRGSRWRRLRMWVTKSS